MVPLCIIIAPLGVDEEDVEEVGEVPKVGVPVVVVADVVDNDICCDDENGDMDDDDDDLGGLPPIPILPSPSIPEPNDAGKRLRMLFLVGVSCVLLVAGPPPAVTAAVVVVAVPPPRLCLRGCF